MSDNETTRLRAKLEQARSVIASLVGDGLAAGAEGQRALDYFASDRFEPDFLPWPRTASEGTRPEDLNAANDD
ncbi:MAG: hypothetical protein KL840_18510 [Aquamicrobium sp.]|nr:hypothetical protein [Aquamicrobium sp.]